MSGKRIDECKVAEDTYTYATTARNIWKVSTLAAPVSAKLSLFPVLWKVQRPRQQPYLAYQNTEFPIERR